MCTGRSTHLSSGPYRRCWLQCLAYIPVALTEFVTAGAIVGGEGGIGGTGSVITAGAFIKQLRSLAKDKSVKAVVLRVDSPGGDALASDLMWREIRQLAAKKPVVASMGDVAASGG